VFLARSWIAAFPPGAIPTEPGRPCCCLLSQLQRARGKPS